MERGGRGDGERGSGGGERRERARMRGRGISDRESGKIGARNCYCLTENS